MNQKLIDLARIMKAEEVNNPNRQKYLIDVTNFAKTRGFDPVKLDEQLELLLSDYTLHLEDVFELLEVLNLEVNYICKFNNSINNDCSTFVKKYNNFNEYLDFKRNEYTFKTLLTDISDEEIEEGEFTVTYEYLSNIIEVSFMIENTVINIYERILYQNQDTLYKLINKEI